MLDKWTSELVADMHMHRITRTQLADKLNYTLEYVSMVLNGKREPKNAEQVFRSALDELITEKNK